MNYESKLSTIMTDNRLQEFKAVCKFIERADTKTLALLIAEIQCVHNNLIVWNPTTKHLDDVESVSVNDGAVQLNLKPYEIRKDV